MLPSIHLDHQPSLHACEIEHIRAHRYLPAEAAAGDLPSSQSKPQTPFSFGHIGTQPAGTLDVPMRSGMTLHR
jgi:hypothetical protein